MSTHKNLDKLCVVVIVLALLLTMLFMNGERFGLEAVVDEDAEAYAGSVFFTANDVNGSWDTAGATVITLNGTDAEISGEGAYVYDGNVVISNGGTYVVSGTLSDGSIVVDAYSSSKVWILLNGVEISCSDDACFRVNEADKVFLTLADGTENSFASGAVYSDDALSDGTDGAIFAHDDLTINGSGSLSVSAAYKHGIAANDALVIVDASILVQASKDAVRANDSLCMKDASISVDAGDDGIVVAGVADEDAEKEVGYLYIESGSYQITSADDGIHTTGDITVAGGDFEIAAGDDGIHSDTGIVIDDGTILISECYEGIEAITIDVNGGDIVVYPTDDGFNANGGSSGFGGFGGGGFGGRGGFGRGGFDGGDFDGGSSGTDSDMDDASDTDSDTYLRITGGSITVINETGQDADGLDSNGDIIITGGTIRISVVDGQGNCAIDFGSESGGVCEISGGTVIACGNYSMAEGFDSTSEQCSILYNISAGAEAGTTVSLEDTDGNVILSYDVPCSFSSLILSCPEMQLNETYLVVIGDDVEEITLDEVSASFGDAESSMFGGNMNWGGMQPRGGFGGGHGPGGRGGRNWNTDQNADSDSSAAATNSNPSDDTSEVAADADIPSDNNLSEFMNDGRGFPPDMETSADAESSFGAENMTGMEFPPDMSDMTPPFDGNFPGWDESANSEVEEGDTLSDNSFTPDMQTWCWLGGSALVLLAGIFIVIKYRRY